MAFGNIRKWQKLEQDRRVMSTAIRTGEPGKTELLRHGQTYYRLRGPENAPLMICIHGWSTASYVWEPLMDAFLDKGYRVLTWDLYGRGLSDRPEEPQTAELFTGQLEDLMDRLHLPKRNLTIVGYSMGGAIAAHFVNKHLSSVARLLLLAPAGMNVIAPITRGVARQFPSVADAHIKANLHKLLDWQFRSLVKDHQDNVAALEVEKNQLHELKYRGYIPSLVESLKGILSRNMKQEHRKIAASDIEVMALFGARDTTIPIYAKLTFDFWNGNDVSHVIGNASHALTYTHAREIDEIAGDFLTLS